MGVYWCPIKGAENSMPNRRSIARCAAESFSFSVRCFRPSAAFDTGSISFYFPSLARSTLPHSLGIPIIASISNVLLIAKQEIYPASIVLQEATNEKLLAQMYMGWAPYLWSDIRVVLIKRCKLIICPTCSLIISFIAPFLYSTYVLITIYLYLFYSFASGLSSISYGNLSQLSKPLCMLCIFVYPLHPCVHPIATTLLGSRNLLANAQPSL